MYTSRSGVTNLFAIAGHFVSYRWVSGPDNSLVILWNLLKNEKKRLEASKKVQDCWSRLNTSRAARNSFAGRMFVTSGPDEINPAPSCMCWELPYWLSS